jgi:hypothetical protein
MVIERAKIAGKTPPPPQRQGIARDVAPTEWFH